MNIIVTGQTGVGKTTVCEKVIRIAKESGYTCGGILTPKSLQGSVICGIDIVDIQSGEREILASTHDLYRGPRAGKYSFNPDGIQFGIRAIEKGCSSDILLVDEIGHLERRGEGFVKVLTLIGSGEVRNSVLVIRKDLLSAFLPQLGPAPYVFETTPDIRDELPQKVFSRLTVTSGVFP